MLKIGGQKVPSSLVLLVAADSALTAIGLLLATIIRFGPGGFGPVLSHFLSSWSVLRYFLVIFVCEISLYFNDLYDFQVIAIRSELLVRLLQAFGVTCLALAVCYYAAPELSLGRGIAALSAPMIVTLTLGWR